MKIFVFCLSVLFVAQLSAHPTSFEGSTGVMGYHSPGFSHNQINYSHKYWFAVGAHQFRKNYDDESNRTAHFVSTNFLLKRWNGANYQGNTYAVLGAGTSEFSGEAKSASLYKLQFDIEDRKFYFLAKADRIIADNQEDYRALNIRLGIAPYVEGFTGIHSWLILDWTESKVIGENHQTELTPTLRVFYRNLLFEIGQSFSGKTVFNYISHF